MKARHVNVIVKAEDYELVKRLAEKFEVRVSDVFRAALKRGCQQLQEQADFFDVKKAA